MKKKRRKQSKGKSKFLIALVVFAIFAMIYSGAREIKTTMDIRMSIEENKKESVALDERKQELENTKENLTNPDYIEYLARGKYLVTKDGEQVFKFKNDENK